MEYAENTVDKGACCSQRCLKPADVHENFGCRLWTKAEMKREGGKEESSFLGKGGLYERLGGSKANQPGRIELRHREFRRVTVDP